MGRELTRTEKAAIRRLVSKWCANYDRDCGCLPLDCECYMFGYLLMRVLEDALGMTLTMSAGVAELAIGFSMAVGVIFGLYPANKASKLKPIDALHYD